MNISQIIDPTKRRIDLSVVFRLWIYGYQLIHRNANVVLFGKHHREEVK
jgi:hypothetical protein